MPETRVWKEGMREPRMIKPGVSSQRMTTLLDMQDKRSIAQTANLLALDTSDSMNDKTGHGDMRKKIEGLKEAVTAFIVNLPSTSLLSIVCFSWTASVLCPMAAVSQGKLKIIQKVQGLKAGGTTAMKSALKNAEEQFRKVQGEYAKRLYLLTDGMPNTNPSKVTDRLKQQKVQIHTIGFGEGNDIDENLLRSMASTSASGTQLYYHFTDAKNLTTFLKKQTQTLTV